MPPLIQYALQTEVSTFGFACSISDKHLGTVKAASLQKTGEVDIIRPSWILDCIKQGEVDAGLPDLLLPFEPRYAIPLKGMRLLLISKRHMFFTSKDKETISANVDQFNDSYCRDTTFEELHHVSTSKPWHDHLLTQKAPRANGQSSGRRSTLQSWSRRKTNRALSRKSQFGLDTAVRVGVQRIDSIFP